MRTRAKVVLSRRTGCDFLDWPRLRRVLLKILEDHRVRGTLDLAVVSDEEIRGIHRAFIGEDRATDVLSFRLDGDRPGDHDDIFGEVVVSAETARREALRRRLPPAGELALYAIHGALHLVGFDDRDARCRQKMRRMERRYVAAYSRAGG